MSLGGLPVPSLAFNNSVPPQAAAQTASSQSQHSGNGATAGSSNPTANKSVTYGYHNSFHTHAVPKDDSPPPSYEKTTREKTVRPQSPSAPKADVLPRYSCTISLSGVLGMKPELSTPFMVAGDRRWREVYVELRGTQLLIYRLKTSSIFSKPKPPAAGHLIRAYTLQHAEVGLASDFKKTGPIPKSAFAKLIPVAARAKVYETDPHLFEPMREHVLRLRLEEQQFLLCCETQDGMLDWVEHLCTAIDIAPPLEDRSEPRNKTLPRRARRQRSLEGRLGDLDNLNRIPGGRRILEEQERIIRTLYPRLAGETPAAGEGSAGSDRPASSERNDREGEHSHGSAYEAEDLDREDALFPGHSTARPTTATQNSSSQASSPSRSPSRRSSEAPQAVAERDPKRLPPHRLTRSQILRFRRRCAPILLYNSPRASEIIFANDKRLRIDCKNYKLVRFEPYPPKYAAHNFPKAAARSADTSEANRPSVARSDSDGTITSLNSLDSEHDLHDLEPTSSISDSGRGQSGSIDSIDAITQSNDRPTTATRTKAEHGYVLNAIAGLIPKARTSAETGRDTSSFSFVGGLGVF